MNKVLVNLSLLIFLLTACSSTNDEAIQSEQTATASPYVEMADQEIKALPEERIQVLLNGAGGGYALSAELNSYPGPLHVLELSSELMLTKEQEQSTKEIYNQMKEKAQSIGKEMVDLEFQLENAFRSKNLTKVDVENMTNQISILDGKLRSVHLNAHIDMIDVLNDDQIKLYDELRGYTSDHQ